MKELREIAKLITSKQQKHLDIFHDDILEEKDNHYIRFFQNLRDGNYLSDDDAALDLYNSKPSTKKYQMLKSRVRKRLHNTLFFLDIQQPEHSARAEAYYECLKGIVQVEILEIGSAPNSAIELCKKVLIKARDFQLTEIELSCLRKLKRSESVRGSQKEYESLVQNLSTTLEVYNAETNAEELFDRVQVTFAKTGALKTEHIALVEESLGKIDSLRKRYNRFCLHRWYYTLLTHNLQLNKRHRETLKVCHDFERFITNQPRFYAKAIHARFTLRQLICCTQLRDYKQGAKIAKKCEKLLERESQFWYAFQEYYFVLTMHTGKFEKALEVYRQVTSSKRLELQYDRFQEKWKIFEAYLEYALEHERKKTEPKTNGFVRRRFDIYNFLNEVPIYSKDKRGYNVSILILQFLFLLEWEDLDGIMNRIDALKRYMGRYLRRDEHYRSQCFLKMLQKMESKNFDPDETEAATKSYYEKLTSTHNEFTGSLDTLEVIPFDVLWLRVLETLRRLKKQGVLIQPSN